MTDHFERELSGMLNDRAADVPTTFDMPPALLRRAQRRRSVKVAAVTAVGLVVVIGGVGAVARPFGGSAHHLSVSKPNGDSTGTTTPARTSVATVKCPIEYALTGNEFPAPSTAERVPTAGDAALLGNLVSYAATTDPRYVVLAPAGWNCKTTVAADGQNAMSLAPRDATASRAPSISVLDDYLWHGGVGAPQACRVFHDQELLNYVATNFPEQSCRRTGRTTTRVDEHVVTFVDADGTRGAGWMVLPTSVNGPDDGKFSVLTCRPGAGLTAAECDTVIADFIARVDVTHVTTNAVMLATAPFAALDWAATADGLLITGPVGKGLAAYAAASDRWRTYDPPPFAGLPYLVAIRANTAYAMSTPGDTRSSTPFAALDLATGAWQSRAPVPAGVPSLRSVGDASRIFGVGSFEDVGDTPPVMTVAVEYDVASDRWTKLPESPLGARAGSALAWTGKELLVWSGGSNHQGGVPGYTDGAAYNPDSGTWRALPTAPISGRAWAATVWTGTEMLVWGGDDCGCPDPPKGQNAAYNPATNAWRTLPASSLTSTRVATGTWTGKEFVVLGGGAPREAGVAAYNPSSDTWRALPAPPDAARAIGDAAFATYVDGRLMLATSAQGQLALFAYPAGT